MESEVGRTWFLSFTVTYLQLLPFIQKAVSLEVGRCTVDCTVPKWVILGQILPVSDVYRVDTVNETVFWPALLHWPKESLDGHLKCHTSINPKL